MGKRSNAVVVLSSDDDDNDNDGINKNCSSSNSKSNRRNFKSQSKSKSKSTSRKKRRSDSLSVSAELFSGFDEMQLKFFSEDFVEDFVGFKVSTGSRRPHDTVSWVDKYRPCSLEELAVHKKKVEEVRMWFEERLTTPKKGFQNYVLLITGQAGTGKSATVHVVASHFGAELCEWNTPIPTVWQEHVHNSNSGMRYISKLDEFENFVERVRKFGVLPSSISSSKTSIILLIEDLPVTNGKTAQERLIRCLQLLVKSAQTPTVILITDYSGVDTADASVSYRDKLLSSLESAGACKVAFNPITVNSIKKVLTRICRQEQCDTTCEQIDLIANASGGDIRHAITTLQYFCLRQEKKVLACSNKNTSDTKTSVHDHDRKDSGTSFPLGRDPTLSLFHALGKFLHNKRENDSTMASDEDGFLLKEGFTRLPLKMDAPEKVLCQAYGQARPVAEFLHENVLEFLSEDAIEDAWAVVSYLSDADCLLSSAHRRNYEAENVVQSAAASVAVRGVLFGNAHPSPSRWHSIRPPKLWQVEQSARRNMNEMYRQRLDHYNGVSLSNVSTVCIEYRPALKWLGYRASLPYSSKRGNKLQEDEDQIISLDTGSESTDDEIEDW